MDNVYIRHDTEGRTGHGLVASLEDGRRLVRAPTVIGLLLALRVMDIPDDVLVIRSPAIDRGEGALTEEQYAELVAVLGRSTGRD